MLVPWISHILIRPPTLLMLKPVRDLSLQQGPTDQVCRFPHSIPLPERQHIDDSSQHLTCHALGRLYCQSRRRTLP
eukprot:UN20845